MSSRCLYRRSGKVRVGKASSGGQKWAMGRTGYNGCVVHPLSRNKPRIEPSTDAKIRQELIKTIKEGYNVRGIIVNLVRSTVSSTLRAEGTIGGDFKILTSNVLKGGIGAAETAGLGSASTSRNMAKGIILGVHDVGGDIVMAADHTFKCAVNEALFVRGDVAQIARAACDGVIEATREIGGNLEEVAKTLVTGAIQSASLMAKRR